jgi:hypothetical protein
MLNNLRILEKTVNLISRTQCQSWQPVGLRNTGKARDNMIGKLYSLEYSDIPKVFFTPNHVSHCCSDPRSLLCLRLFLH